MLSALLLSIGIPVLGSGTATDVAAGIRVNDRLGLLPERQGSTSVATNQLRLGVPAGLWVHNERTDLRLRYNPSLSLVVPNPLNTARPLFMNALEATYTSEVTQRFNLQMNASGSYGEIAYASLDRILGEDSSSTIDASAVRLLLLNGGTSVSYATSRRLRTNVSVAARYRKGIDAPDVKEASRRFPESYDVIGTLSEAYRLSAVDELAFQGIVTRVSREGSNEDEPDTLGQNPSTLDAFAVTALSFLLKWDRSQDNGDLSVSAGFNAAFPDDDLLDPSYFPTLTGSRTWRFGWLGQHWNTSFKIGAQGFIDQTNGTFRPIAQVSWGLGTTIDGDWNLTSQLSASTALTQEPFVPAQYETQFNWRAPVSYRVSHKLTLELGLQASLRYGHYTQFLTPDPQMSFSGTFGFKYAVGTDADHGNWL